LAAIIPSEILFPVLPVLTSTSNALPRNLGPIPRSRWVGVKTPVFTPQCPHEKGAGSGAVLSRLTSPSAIHRYATTRRSRPISGGASSTRAKPPLRGCKRTLKYIQSSWPALGGFNSSTFIPLLTATDVRRDRFLLFAFTEQVTISSGSSLSASITTATGPLITKRSGACATAG